MGWKGSNFRRAGRHGDSDRVRRV